MRYCLLLAFITACAVATGPIVVTPLGAVSGRTTPSGGATFKGVRYSPPPTGARRCARITDTSMQLTQPVCVQVLAV